MNLITCKKSKGGGNSLKFRVKSEEVRVFSLSFILGSARRIFLAAVVATTATASWAADAYWTGATDNYFKTAGNWDISAKPTSQTTFFQASYFNSRFTENEVVFDDAFSISAQFSVRDVLPITNSNVQSLGVDNIGIGNTFTLAILNREAS